MSALGKLIAKIPWALFFGAFVIVKGYGLLQFYTDETSSPYLQKSNQLEQENRRIVDLERKKREAEEFLKSLESKRAELRAAALELAQMKSSLAEELDIASFIKMLVTEAKRVNIRVQAITPAGEETKDFTIAQRFKFEFRGVFAQVVVFLERLLQTNRIVSVDSYDFTVPQQASAGRYAELQGSLTIKTYRYNRSKADEVASKQGNSP